MAARLERFRSHFDQVRSAVVNEPRGSNAMVGALLCEPTNSRCVAGVIFFNNVGYLGMCGHGAIGVGATLSYLRRISPGAHLLETPVGVVGIELHENGEVSVENVASYRAAKSVTVEVRGVGWVTGDVAWGGNWFFLTNSPFTIALNNLEQLTDFTSRVRQSLTENGITGDNGEEIDHIEVFSAPHDPANHSRNFVLCPGKEYDRSPCGTGTSAKLACLYADGRLQEGEVWRQESVIGTVFEGSFVVRDGRVFPRIKGAAFVSADSCLVLQEKDPFRWGIRA
jgi:4-hydroxyproline epimerase